MHTRPRLRNQAGIFDGAAQEAGRPPPEAITNRRALRRNQSRTEANLKAVETTVPDQPHNPNEVRSRKIGDNSPPAVLHHQHRRKGFRFGWQSRTQPHVCGPEKGFRVVAMGAAESFGWGVPYEQSYPAH